MIYQGDNTGAFGVNLITIDIDNPNNIPITRAAFVCGDITKTFKAGSHHGKTGSETLKFPLKINFEEWETPKLKYKNVCYLIVWDNMGRKCTCDGTLTFYTNRGVEIK